MNTLQQHLFHLLPHYQERVWGGQKLKPSDPPVGEAWIADQNSRVNNGPHSNATIAQLARDYREQFLGSDVGQRFGDRFPLLVKLLDCADWLSVQVHPDDEQARRLVGPGEFGKTEAWHFLEVEQGAQILAGVQPGTTAGTLERAIRDGRIMDVALRHDVSNGDTVFIPAGTLHALGPGMLLYEVQQSSDTTYRVYDWDRPASAGRRLHIEESVAVTDPNKNPTVRPAGDQEPDAFTAVTCPYFELDVLLVETPVARDTQQRSFHILTITDGRVTVQAGQELVTLGRFETLVVAGTAGAYEIRSLDGTAKVLAARVPGAPSAAD